jgi:hypothetical protein
MVKDINLTAIILAITTFLWYRKGRLWNFYDALLIKYSEQIKSNSLDRKQWGKIALEQCADLSQDTFQSLFRFEVEYLRKSILDNNYEFWIADSEAVNGTQVTYTDKEAFCRYRLSELFLPDLRFCGLRLFYRALCWHINKAKDEDKGFEVKQLTSEQQQVNNDDK